MDLKNHIKIENNKSEIRVKVVANSKKNGFFGIMENGHLKIKISSPAENGKANNELISFISKELKIAKKNIHILSGEHCSNKLIKIDF